MILMNTALFNLIHAAWCMGLGQGVSVQSAVIKIILSSCRRCPGENIADLYLFLVISRMLALFKISCMVEEGEQLRLEFDPGVVA